MFPLIPLLMQAGPSIIQAFTGKKKTSPSGFVVKSTKGLFRSKTARDVTVTLGVKMVFVLALPLPPWAHWVAVPALIIEWAAQLYRRVKTSEPVV